MNIDILLGGIDALTESNMFLQDQNIANQIKHGIRTISTEVSTQITNIDSNVHYLFSKVDCLESSGIGTQADLLNALETIANQSAIISAAFAELSNALRR